MWEYNYNKTSNEMYHWGITGQRWGVRRFQNPDGTLTPEGKARYGNITDPDVLQSTLEEAGLQLEADTYNGIKSVSKSGSEAIEKTRLKLKQNADAKKIAAAYKNAGYMDNDELKQKVERLALEKRYAELAQKDVKTGGDKAEKYLKYGIEAVELVGGIAGIAYTLTRLKQGKAAV